MRGWATALVAVTTLASPAGAANVVIHNLDPAGFGLNDPTPVAPVGGNPGTTLGQQRLNVMQFAADAWGNTLASDVPIDVLAFFDDELFCDASSAVLGAAGTTVIFRDDGSALPRANTWYHSALAEAIVGQDVSEEDGDIAAFFNPKLDSVPGCLTGLEWWYGTTQGPPNDDFIDFYTTVLHEYGHGLGFSTFANKATGEKFQGFDDIYMVFLEDGSLGQNWPSMTNTQRANSAKDDGDLVWDGPNVMANSGFLAAGRKPSGKVQIYAPTSLSQGSSVSHFDTDLTPNELMEPFLENDGLAVLAVNALVDEGWELLATGNCTPTSTTACLQNGRFRVQVEWTDFALVDHDAFVSTQSTENSAIFYFLDETNLEFVLKVLNGCPLNNHYWVFGAGATSVGYLITVTDTDTGSFRQYSNPLGNAAPAITDTSAFATCP
jgi:hypothetical protein